MPIRPSVMAMLALLLLGLVLTYEMFPTQRGLITFVAMIAMLMSSRR